MDGVVPTPESLLNLIRYHAKVDVAGGYLIDEDGNYNDFCFMLEAQDWTLKFSQVYERSILLSDVGLEWFLGSAVRGNWFENEMQQSEHTEYPGKVCHTTSPGFLVKTELIKRIPFDPEILWQQMVILEWFMRMSKQEPFSVLVGSSVTAELRFAKPDGGNDPQMLWGSGMIHKLNETSVHYASTMFAYNADIRQLQFPDHYGRDILNIGCTLVSGNCEIPAWVYRGTIPFVFGGCIDIFLPEVEVVTPFDLFQKELLLRKKNNISHTRSPSS